MSYQDQSSPMYAHRNSTFDAPTTLQFIINSLRYHALECMEVETKWSSSEPLLHPDLLFLSLPAARRVCGTPEPVQRRRL